jgi:hypothetical protein
MREDGDDNMRKTTLFSLAFAAISWPFGQALACQTTYEEEARGLAQLERDRRNAEVVTVGIWTPDTSCINDRGQQCTAGLTVSEVRRGDPGPELKVRFKVPESMCEFDAPLMNTQGLFYLNRDENAETYSVVDFERIETSNQ